MKKKAAIVSGIVLALSITGVVAQNLSVIKQRQDILKGFGEAAKVPGAMLQGKAPFALEPVQAALKVMVEGAPKLQTLFPDDSKTGGDTEALAKIWETPADTADFNSRFQMLGTGAATALVAIKDEATFKAEMGKVFGNCGGCHKLYRKPK